MDDHSAISRGDREGGRYHPGELLVATPVLEDTNFSRAIVLLLDHDRDGALGVVLNRPGEVPVGQVLPGWERLAADPGVVFGGGPVQPEAIVGLARVRPEVEPDPTRGAGPGGAWEPHWEPVVEGVRIVDLSGDAALAALEVSAVRVFAGYAGWGPGQLESELDEEAWVTVRPDRHDLFSPDPGRLWRSVLRRQPGQLRLLSTFPEAPWMN